MDLSIIIVFHNNKREAQRSLYSLSKKYQRNISDLKYEVLCIDSNSTDPLEAKDFENLGPEFTFHRFQIDNPSPVGALQYGIDNAKSEHLGIIIDGAHIITPNVLNYFNQLSKLDSNYFVYTHPFHIGEYYQNDNMVKFKYNQEVEDKLIKSVDWKANGYMLFEISNYKQSNEPFLSNVFESNCFFISKSHLSKVGGVNNKFTSRGGGFINLDVFKRVVEYPTTKTTALLGEGSFHQFHGGTSTNSERNSELQKMFREEYQTVTLKSYQGPIYTPELYGKFINKHISIDSPNTTHAKIINELNQIKKHQSASDVLSILNKKHPFKEEYYISHIRTLSQAGLYEEAEKIIKIVSDINPNNLKVLDCIAKHYFLKDDIQEVKRINNKILEIDPINFNSLVLKFRLHADDENKDIANHTIKLLKEQSERIKANPIGDSLGLLCLGKGYIEEATYFHDLSKNFNTNIDHNILKISLAEKTGNTLSTEELKSIVERINPRTEQLGRIVHLIKVLNNNDQWELGIVLNQKIKLYYPEESIYDYFYGKYYYNYKKFEKCEEHLRRFIKSDTNRFLFPGAHYMLSKLALKKKDYNLYHKHAHESYKKIKNTKYGLNYARSLQFLQNYKPAIGILERVFEFKNVDKEKVRNQINKSAHKVGDIETLKKYDASPNLITELESRLEKSKDFKPVIFTHIQKCGGTSFRRFISNSALYSGIKPHEIHIPGQNGQSPNTNLITLGDEDLNNVKKNNIKVLADHSSFRSEKVKNVIPNYEDAFNLTYFRHPIKRIYSSYYYFYYGKNFKKDDYIEKKLNDLSPKLLNEFIRQNANVATAFLSSSMWAPNFIDVKPEHLPLAKANLEYFQFIGITEISSISMKVFNKVKPEYFQTINKDLPRINRGSKVESDRYPNEAIKNKIIKANKLDIKLYNYGLAKFISSYKKYLTKEEISQAKSLKITDESLAKLYT